MYWKMALHADSTDAYAMVRVIWQLVVAASSSHMHAD